MLLCAMKIVVNPLYSHLKDFIAGIPSHNYTCEEVFRHNRNRVEKVTAPDGTQLVIKRYKRPTIGNQIVYTFLRWSKPKRTYIYSGRLRELGDQTPEQVAYIEIFKRGVFHTGYYISRFVADDLLSNITDLPDEKREAILFDLAQFTYDLHLKGVKHGDYNSGNILYRMENGHYVFTLLDINRMSFRRRITQRTSIKEFQCLLRHKDTLTVAGRYAALRGWNVDFFCGAILIARSFNITKRLKTILRFLIRPFVSKDNKKYYPDKTILTISG